MLYTCLFRQVIQCLAGLSHAIGQYVSALSRAGHTASIPFGGQLEFVGYMHRCGVIAPTTGAWELRPSDGDEGPASQRAK